MRTSSKRGNYYVSIVPQRSHTSARRARSAVATPRVADAQAGARAGTARRGRLRRQHLMTSKLARTRRLAPGRAVPSNQQVGRALKTTCDRVANNPDKFRALLAHPDVIQTSKPHPDIQTRPRREPDGPDKTGTAQTQPQIWIHVWIPEWTDPSGDVTVSCSLVVFCAPTLRSARSSVLHRVCAAPTA